MSSSSKAPGGGIKPFRSGDPMDEKDANRTWQSLKDAIRQIHQHNASSLSFEELYRNAYNLVLHKYGDLLYTGVQQVVTDHLRDVAVTCVDCPDNQLLDELQKRWNDHRTTMVMIRDILMYMDRNFVNQYKKVPVYEMGLTVFRENVSGHAKVKDRLLTIMLERIAKEREGEKIDTLTLKHTVQMLVDLGVQNKSIYREFFEEPFLQATGDHYRAESSLYISNNTCPDFLRKAEKRIREERVRVENYLHESTLEKLMALMDKSWILDHYKTLIGMENSGCAAMFTHDKTADVERMYNLFLRVPETLKGIQKVMIECISASGKEILDNPEKVKEPVSFISALLTLKHKYDVFVRESFKESKDFQQSLKQAFEGFLNKDTRTAQYLSLFVDDMLKKGLKGMTEAEVDTNLEQVVTIFRFLQDKDVFENFYKQHLAKRLLIGRSLSDDAEKSMISKLKSECGHLYTSKLEGMFQDMKLSEDLMKSYKASTPAQEPGANGRSLVELRASVLTSGFWPNTNCPACELPAEIVECCQRFEGYYLAKHTGRRLTWQPNQGTADMKANLPAKRYEINVSTYQMCIVMLFNTHQTLTYADIAMKTNIPAEELKRHLMSLYVNPKCKLFIKNGGNTGNDKSKAEPVDSDVFEVNPNFESKLYRIKIPLVQMKSIAGDSMPSGSGDVSKSGDVPATVEEDRKHLVEAHIVRVMKSRKTLEHNQLVMEVTRMLSTRFTPTPLLIKQRIEKLIEREYLDRSQHDRKVYNYLA